MDFSSSVARVTSHVTGESRRSDGIQISVRSSQDGDFDDSNEKDRNTKRKKRKSGLSFRNTAYRWKLQILSLAMLGLIVIVVFEVRRLSHDSQSATRVSLDGPKNLKLLETDWANLIDEKQDSEKHGNLNKMDMPTRNGIPCLQLLPEDELRQLKLPPSKTSSAVETLLYGEGRDFCKRQGAERFNKEIAFVGDQSLEQRARSFEVQASMEVHCGFCDEDDAFKINSRDKAYMADCKIVVLTCSFGGGDDLYQPIGMTNTSLSQVCYVAFWDEVTLDIQATKRKIPDPETGKIGLWRVVLVKNLPFADQRRNGKIPKLLNHRLFPDARYSIWVDSKSQFRRDPMGVIEALLWKPKSVFAISQHGARSCVYEEGNAIVQKKKAQPEEVRVQLDQYLGENFPKDASFDGKKALAEASFIVREHTPLTNLFMCNWFNEVARFTARDQLSFPYVLVKLQEMHPNMFSVCTRRALVNSIGHTGKKPKPLSSKSRGVLG